MTKISDNMLKFMNNHWNPSGNITLVALALHATTSTFVN